MASLNDGKELKELVLPYARWGADRWREQPKEIREQAEETLDVEIASPELVTKTVMSPIGSTQPILRLIPMPCDARDVTCSFFAPVLSHNSCTSFHLVVLAEKGQLAFRIEPGDVGSGWAHRYDHVQLCKSIGHRSYTLPNAPEWLPESYPAFPVPGESIVSRFLAMIVAMHGFADSLKAVFEMIFPSRPTLRRKYSEITEDLLKPVLDV